MEWLFLVQLARRGIPMFESFLRPSVRRRLLFLMAFPSYAVSARLCVSLNKGTGLMKPFVVRDCLNSYERYIMLNQNLSIRLASVKQSTGCLIAMHRQLIASKSRISW